MKLSKRLHTLKTLISTQYDHIWDCCCDHGFLGRSLLEDERHTAKVHFVDIVPELIEKLSKSLLDGSLCQSSWETHCIDTNQLPLADYAGRHLVVIAGVGGDLTAQFSQSLISQFAQLPFDLLLCPVHHNYTLRQALIAHHTGLINEVLIEENKRFYEAILVTTKPQCAAPLSPTGDKLWQENPSTAKRYLNTTLAHYQRMLKHDPSVSKIINAYQAIDIND